MKLNSLVRWLIGIALFSLAFASGWQNIAHADSLVVNTLTDENDHSCSDGDCSLRDAIEVAASGDTITFNVSGTIMLQGDLTLEKNITISGPGATNLTLTGDNYTVVFL